MKIVNLILTYLVAALFLFAGISYFFMKPQAMPPGDAATFGTLLASTKYMVVVKVFEIIGALMLALNFRRALGWAILLPVIINIVLFELLLAHQPSVGVALLIIDLYMILYVHREKFRPLLTS